MDTPVIHKYPNEFSSDRLKFRPLTINDIDDWNAFLRDDESTKYYTADTTTYDDPADVWIERQMKRYKNGEFGLLAVEEKETGRFVGQTGIIAQNIGGFQELEVGYHLMPDSRKKGYATEAALYFRDMAFENFDAESVISIIHEDNLPSQQVAIRNGMEADFWTCWRGLNVVVFRITRDEWKEIKDRQ